MDKENNHWHTCMYACMQLSEKGGKARKKEKERGKKWVEYHRIFFFLFFWLVQ